MTRDNSWASVIVSLLTLLHGWKILNWVPSGREESTHLRERRSVGGLTFQRVLRMLIFVVFYIRRAQKLLHHASAQAGESVEKPRVTNVEGGKNPRSQNLKIKGENSDTTLILH